MKSQDDYIRRKRAGQMYRIAEAEQLVGKKIEVWSKRLTKISSCARGRVGEVFSRKRCTLTLYRLLEDKV